MNISNSYCLACTTKPTQIEDEPFIFDDAAPCMFEPVRGTAMCRPNRLIGTKNRPKPLILMTIPGLVTRLADMMLMYSANKNGE